MSGAVCEPPEQPIGLVLVHDEAGAWIGELLEPLPARGLVAVARPRKPVAHPNAVQTWERVTVGVRRVRPVR